MRWLCRNVLRLVLVGALLSSSPMTAPAGAAEDGAIRFCFNDWPPYSYVRDGKDQGISVDILREAARRAGLEPSFTELPWKRCLALVEAGEFDAVMDAAQRDEFLQGDVSPTIYTNTLWVRADDPATSIDVDNLGGRSIGLISGYKYGEILDACFNKPNVHKEYSKDDPTNIKNSGSVGSMRSSVTMSSQKTSPTRMGWH